LTSERGAAANADRSTHGVFVFGNCKQFIQIHS
jgi:hypothetical protein